MSDDQVFWSVRDLAESFKRFIDDVNTVFDVLPPGTEFSNNQILIHPDLVDTDKNVPDDKRTMEVIKEYCQ